MKISRCALVSLKLENDDTEFDVLFLDESHDDLEGRTTFVGSADPVDSETP